MPRRLSSVFLLAGLFTSALQAATFQVSGTDHNPWLHILESVGIHEDATAEPAIVVAGANSDASLAQLAESRILVLEGAGLAAEKLGIHTAGSAVAVRQIVDVHAPAMQIVWEVPQEVAPVKLPDDFQVFAKEKWKGIPLLAGKRTSRGAILWLAANPGPGGFERFPYLLQALTDLGLTAPAAATNLWAFFDSAYRSRADSDYLAKRWRAAGVSALHIAAWHNMEPDAAQDQYLADLIKACHKNAILVYAWLELPHVSEHFWAEHPAWREKTAVGQDAQLDWRKLMNLQNRDCKAEVARQVRVLLKRFDWDGVNLAELYFESLEGAANPARFTPMDEDVRVEFERTAGFDPQRLFEMNSPVNAAAHPEALRKFLDFRAGLVSRMQTDWLNEMNQARMNKPYLDLVLTHIDDRFDRGIRDELGADVQQSLPAIQASKCTLLIEDPATLWALGPERYARLAAKYEELSAERKHFAVDINVVDRYQDVYPTKKQTGVELFELLHQAAVSFGQVALYFENSLERQDLELLPAASTSAIIRQKAPDELEITARDVTRVAWQGPTELDGKLWPVQNARFVLTPAGTHRLTVAAARAAITVKDFNGNLRSANTSANRVDLDYQSASRAILIPGTPGRFRIEIDGVSRAILDSASGGEPLLLPAGQHIVSLIR